MLVIASDIHLTDGTSGATIREGAFRTFRQRLRDLAYDASWRAPASVDQKARYEPIEQFDIILLGDILDVIRSSKWLDDDQKGVRPWDIASRRPERRVALEKKVAQIARAILKNNKASLKVLKGFSVGRKATEWITLPPATDAGRVDETVGWEAEAEGRVRVKVRIHYVVGNHEWFFNLPGAGYDRIRSDIKKAMGLANDPNVPFPHDPQESASLAGILREHRVWARHGDIYDSFNYRKEAGRRAASLGDAIVIELIDRFPHVVGELDVPDAVKEGLREIDNVRPNVLVPVWIDGLLRRSRATRKQKKVVKAAWNDLVDAFLDLDFVKDQDKFMRLDDVDKLQVVLKFSRGVSLPGLSRIVRWYDKVISGRGDRFYKNALTETAFESRAADFIVYGHTHRQTIVPLDVTDLRNGKQLTQVYLNTGTWRRVHTLAQWKPGEREFVDHNVMTYVAFFRDGERGGRRFESWSGALGV